MAIYNSFNYAISQSITESFKSDETVEFSFLAMGNNTNFGSTAEQSVDLYYTLNSESINWIQVENYPKSFPVATNYTTKSFTAFPTQDWQGVKAVITGSIFTQSGQVNFNTNTMPSIELDYDRLELKSYTPTSELTQDGLFVFRAPSRFIRANKDGVELRGGEIKTDKIRTEALEVYGDATIFGDFLASPVPPFDEEMIDITSIDGGDLGSSQAYARGDHTHFLPFTTVNSAINNQTFSNLLRTQETKLGTELTHRHRITGSLLITGSLVEIDCADLNFKGTDQSLNFHHNTLTNVAQINIQDTGYEEGLAWKNNAHSHIYVNQINTTQNYDSSDTTSTLTLANEINNGRAAGILLRDESNLTLLATGSRVGIGTANPSNALTVVGSISASNSIFSDGQFRSSGSNNGFQVLGMRSDHPNWDGGLYRYSGQAYISFDDNLYFRDYNDDVNRLHIGGDGKVRIYQDLLVDGYISASKDIVFDDYTDTAIRFLDGSKSATTNYITYRDWVTAATAGKTITNTTGIIKLESKAQSDVLVVSHSKVGVGTAIPDQTLTVAGNISSSGTLHISTINDANDEGASSDLTIDAANLLNIGTSQVDEINIGRQSGTNVDVNIFSDSATPSMKIMNQTVKFNHHITASGNISASNASGVHSFGGKIGIGTAVPERQLHISSSGDAFIEVETGNDDARAGIFFNTERTDAGMNPSYVYKSGSHTEWELDEGIAWNSNGRLTLATNNTATTFYSSSTANAIKTEYARFEHATKRLGIGTTSPTRKLHIVETSANPAALFTSLTDAPITIESTDATTGITFKDSDAEQQIYYRGSLDAFYIESGTKFGLGTSNPSKTLEVIGDISSSGKIYGKDFDFDLDSGDGRRFTGNGSSGVRLQDPVDGWAMTYGWLGNSGTDFGGFGGHGGTALEKFYIGGHYTKPIVSFFSGSSTGVLIGHYDARSSAPKTLTVEGDISASNDLYLEADSNIHFGTDNAVIASTTTNLDIKHIQTDYESGIRLNTDGRIDFALVHNNNLDFNTDTKMTISQSAADGHTRVGINTTKPQKSLHINNSGILIDGGTGVESDAHAGTARFIIDAGGSTAHNLMDLRNDHGTIFKVDGNNDASDFTRVGIGTSSPSYDLDVQGGTNSIIRAYGTSIGRLSLQNNTRHYSTSVQSDKWIFYDETGGKELMRFTENGYLGLNYSGAQIKQALTLQGNMLINPSGSEEPAFIHANNNLAISSDADLLLVADSNDTAGVASNDILIGIGSDVDTNSNKDFTYADAFTGGPRTLAIKVEGTTGNVGIGGVTGPESKLHIAGGGDGQAFGGKDVSLSENWSTILTVGLQDHESCYVKLTMNGNWTNHSGIMFMGEYFISNGGPGGYNEPGQIIRQIDNTGGPSTSATSTPVDAIRTKLVENGDTVEIQAIIVDAADAGAETATANLNFHIMGEFDTIT